MAARVNTVFDPVPEAEVECACIRCSRRFGRYFLEVQNDTKEIVPVDPAGRPAGFMIPVGLFRSAPAYWEPRYGWTRRRKGSRTGTGLHLELFEGRTYVRVKCKCGRNEKLGAKKLDAVLFDSEGELRLRDGVLYL